MVNTLDYAAVTIPVTVVDKRVDVVAPDFKPLSELDQRVMESCELGFLLLLLLLLLLLCCVDWGADVLAVGQMTRKCMTGRMLGCS